MPLGSMSTYCFIITICHYIVEYNILLLSTLHQLTVIRKCMASVTDLQYCLNIASTLRQHCANIAPTLRQHCVNIAPILSQYAVHRIIRIIFFVYLPTLSRYLPKKLKFNYLREAACAR